MQPTGANPSMLLPSNLLRGGSTTPGQIFQQNPLSQNMSPSAMGQQPGLQTPPPAGSQAINPTMPPGGGQPMPGQPQAGQPNTALPGQQPQISESEMILQALMKRLESHSKLTHKTADTIISMIQSQLPQPDPNAPTS